MDDHRKADREGVRQWIHEHADEMAEVSLSWEPAQDADPGAYGQLLNLLFAPRPDSPAA